MKQLLEFHYHGSPTSCYGDITAQYHSRSSQSFVQVLESLGLECVHAYVQVNAYTGMCACVCVHTLLKGGGWGVGFCERLVIIHLGQWTIFGSVLDCSSYLSPRHNFSGGPKPTGAK